MCVRENGLISKPNVAFYNTNLLLATGRTITNSLNPIMSLIVLPFPAESGRNDPGSPHSERVVPAPLQPGAPGPGWVSLRLGVARASCVGVGQPTLSPGDAQLLPQA